MNARKWKCLTFCTSNLQVGSRVLLSFVNLARLYNIPYQMFKTRFQKRMSLRHLHASIYIIVLNSEDVNTRTLNAKDTGLSLAIVEGPLGGQVSTCVSATLLIYPFPVVKKSHKQTVCKKYRGKGHTSPNCTATIPFFFFIGVAYLRKELHCL